MTKYHATIPQHLQYSWESQAEQYAYLDTPGINHERHDVGEFGAPNVIDCLLWRDEAGRLRGILNYYQNDGELERAGNVNLWVHPDWERRGVGTTLLREAMQRWPIDLAQQRYTPKGAAFAERFENLLVAEGLADGQRRTRILQEEVDP